VVRVQCPHHLHGSSCTRRTQAWFSSQFFFDGSIVSNVWTYARVLNVGEKN
jgi:hypothetical protein